MKSAAVAPSGRLALSERRAWDPRDEMRLHVALGDSTSEAPEMGAAFTKALEIAESLGDPEYQLRALPGLYFYHRRAVDTVRRCHLRKGSMNSQ